MLWGGWGERKRERAGHNGKGGNRPPRAFYFFVYFILMHGDTQREPLRRREGHSGEKREPASIANSVGCLWHSHAKNPVRLYPKLQSQPIGLPKIFIDYNFFQANQLDCTRFVSIFNRFASSEER